MVPAMMSGRCASSLRLKWAQHATFEVGWLVSWLKAGMLKTDGRCPGAIEAGGHKFVLFQLRGAQSGRAGKLTFVCGVHVPAQVSGEVREFRASRREGKADLCF